jgi:hypothetical protein
MDENYISDVKHGVLPCKEMALHLNTLQFDADIPASDVIVYETWRPRPKQGSMAWIQGNELLSAQLVGQIRLLGWLSGAKLVGYGPDRKHVAMKSMHADLRDRMEGCHEMHDQDALMHLWMYAFENWVTDPANVTID